MNRINPNKLLLSKWYGVMRIKTCLLFDHPVCFIFRPAEIIRNYLNQEGIPVIIACSGRNNDYHHDGFSHFGGDALPFLDLFPEIRVYVPTTKEGAYNTTVAALKDTKPTAIILSR